MPRQKGKCINLQKRFRLAPKNAVFVVEYLKDCSPRRAAEAAGYTPDHGYKLIERKDILDVIETLLTERMDEAMIDAEWLMYELVDNHLIARQQGNITASNTALSILAKHKNIDAFAAEKLNVSTDSDVLERLNRAKKRNKVARERIDALPPGTDDEVSFI